MRAGQIAVRAGSAAGPRRPRAQRRRPLTGELVRLQPGLGVQPADDEVVGEAAGCRGAAAAAAHAAGRGARGAQRERGRAAGPGSPAAPAASMAARGGRRRAAFWERPPPLAGGAARPRAATPRLRPARGGDVMLLLVALPLAAAGAA